MYDKVWQPKEKIKYLEYNNQEKKMKHLLRLLSTSCYVKILHYKLLY